MVVRGPAGEEHYGVDTTVVVEVLSPSTAKVDRREKAAAYATLPSLGCYRVLDPRRRRAQPGRPGLSDAQPQRGVAYPTGALDLDALFAAVDSAATT
jgi:Uma2 family endonuclease